MAAVPTHRPEPTTVVASRRRAARRRIGPSRPSQRYLYLGLSIASLATVVLGWDLLVRLGAFAPSLLASPADVVDAARQMYSQGTLLDDAAASFRRALSGFLLGSALAIIVGTLTGRSRVARVMLEPTIQVIRPIPAIALVPLAILWFGIGEESKLFLTSLGVFFPVWVNTHAGISSTREDYLRVAACLGAPRHQVFTSVVLPAALPFILTGLRQGIAMSLILIVASEQAGVSEGLGFRLDQARLFSQPDRLLACLFALGIVGALADQLFHRGTRGLVGWAKEQA
jgi:NitT/TauT family transport system permease protein/sulfonate transport system permease protein